MSETVEIMKNIGEHGSIILSKPILFTGNIFETINRFIWLFFLPLTILFSAIKEKDLLLKLTYLLSTIPFILTTPMINKLGFKSLYVIKIIIIFAVIMCLMKYLTNKTGQYKKVFKEKTDNKTNSANANSRAAD